MGAKLHPYRFRPVMRVAVTFIVRIRQAIYEDNKFYLHHCACCAVVGARKKIHRTGHAGWWLAFRFCCVSVHWLEDEEV